MEEEEFYKKAFKKEMRMYVIYKNKKGGISVRAVTYLVITKFGVSPTARDIH